MDANEIVTLFGNGFFPIIMCGLLFWYMTKQTQEHKTEIDGLKDVLNNINVTLAKLEDAINKQSEDK